MFASSDMIRQWNENGKAYFPKFATNAELYAAVAANGGQSLGPAVSVAGETWDWSATRNRYIPGEKVSKATYADLTTLATQMGLGNNAASIGIKCWLVNSLAPDGMTRMYWTGTRWAPVAGQILYGAYGTLLDMTAAALSIGSWSEVWQSPILPDWMFAGNAISVSSQASMADSSSTASIKLRMTIRKESFSAGDHNDASLGFIGNAVSYGSGLSGIRARALLVSGNITGNSGAGVGSSGTMGNRTIGSYGDELTRIRLDAAPGATTNTIKLYSVALWSGE